MSVTLSVVRIVPPNLIAWQLHWLDWRISQLDRQLVRLDSKKKRSSLIANRTTIHQTLSDFACKTTLEVIDKTDKETTLKAERRRIDSKLAPLNQAYDSLTHQRAVCCGRRSVLSLKK